MNTQKQVHALQAGEALALSADTAASFVLAEGEVVFQPAALYLAGTVVLPRPRRISAPASLPPGQAGVVTALRAAKIVATETPGPWAAFTAWRARRAGARPAVPAAPPPARWGRRTATR